MLNGIHLRNNSELIGALCPIDAPFRPGDIVVICPVCETAHHTDCWLANGNHCAILGCTGEGEVAPLEEKAEPEAEEVKPEKEKEEGSRGRVLAREGDVPEVEGVPFENLINFLDGEAGSTPDFGAFLLSFNSEEPLVIKPEELAMVMPATSMPRSKPNLAALMIAFAIAGFLLFLLLGALLQVTLQPLKNVDATAVLITGLCLLIGTFGGAVIGVLIWYGQKS